MGDGEKESPLDVYTNLVKRANDLQDLRNLNYEAANRLSEYSHKALSPGFDPDAVANKAELDKIKAAIAPLLSPTKEGDIAGLSLSDSGGSMIGVLMANGHNAGREATSTAQQAWTMFPQLAPNDIGWLSFEERPKFGQQTQKIEIGGQTFDVSSETAASLAQRNLEHGSLSAGQSAQLGQDMYQFNNLSAAQIANIQVQLQQENRLTEQMKFEVQEAQKNRQVQLAQLELQKAGVQAQFAGLELQRRGQVVQAISEDFAHQIELGRMTYMEAQQRLDTVDKAMTQRRLEREQLLKYAVSSASIHMTAAGEEVTRLPFAEQLVEILSQSTGQKFNVSSFELPVQRINPEAAGQAALNAGAVASPIPALQQGLAAAREAINANLGAPVGTPLANEAAIQNAVKGI